MVLGITKSVIGQNNETLILLPKQGIIINNDTILLGSLKETIIKKFNINEKKISNSITHYDYDDGSYSDIYSSRMKIEEGILLFFEGKFKEKMQLVKVKVSYPQRAKTVNGIEIGDKANKIFEFYPQKDASYNCDDVLYGYCYFDNGISFGVETNTDDNYLIKQMVIF